MSIRTLLSFCGAVLFVAFLAAVFEIDWARTWHNVSSINVLVYLSAIVVYYLTFLFRGARWKILADNAGSWEKDSELAKTSTFRFSQIILIGWFINGIAPLRLGDAYRAYAISERSVGGFSWGLGTILGERFVDMGTVLILAVLAVIWYSAVQDVGGIAYIGIAAAAMTFVLAGLLIAMRGYGNRVAKHLPDRLEQAYRRFHESTLGSLRPRQRRFILLLGLAGWVLEIGRVYLVVEALGLNIAFPLVILVALGHAILSTVPTPGGVGAVEAGIIGILVLGMPRADAVSVALVDRTITYISVVGFGGLALIGSQMPRLVSDTHNRIR